MTEEEKYILDLKGYLVLRSVLSPAEVAEINAVIDRLLPDWHIKSQSGHILTGFDDEAAGAENKDRTKNPTGLYSGRLLDWGEPLRNLVGHDKILPYMIELIGPSLRLDHQYAILMRAKPESAGHMLHCGGTPYDPVHSYHLRDGRCFSGISTVSYALTDVPPDGGGFCCIPGSHKSSVRPPRHFMDVSDPADCVVHVPLNKGDAVIFTEALTHGALPWKSETDGERRAVLFKYCPGHMQWETRPQLPLGNYEWQEHQKYLLMPAYHRFRPPIPWPPTQAEKQSGVTAA